MGNSGTFGVTLDTVPNAGNGHSHLNLSSQERLNWVLAQLTSGKWKWEVHFQKS